MRINPGILAGHLAAQLVCTCIVYASSGFQLTAVSRVVAAVSYMDAGCFAMLLGMLAARTVVYRSPTREEGYERHRRQVLKLYLSLYACMALIIPGISVWSWTVMIRAQWAVWALLVLQILFLSHLTLSQDGLGLRLALLARSSISGAAYPAPQGVPALTSIGTKRNDPSVEDSIELLSDVAGLGGGGEHLGESSSSAMALRSVVADKGRVRAVGHGEIVGE